MSATPHLQPTAKQHSMVCCDVFEKVAGLTGILVVVVTVADQAKNFGNSNHYDSFVHLDKNGRSPAQ